MENYRRLGILSLSTECSSSQITTQRRDNDEGSFREKDSRERNLSDKFIKISSFILVKSLFLKLF
jgi:hypothetical protein